MRLIRFAIFCLLQASSAMAQTTAEQLRDWAYVGDYDAMERRFALAHVQSLNGDISFDELRALTDVVAVSHPQIMQTIDAWLSAIPDSPYANTIRAKQYDNAAWAVRGNRYVNETPRDALITFGQFQTAGMEHATRAYEQAPDFVPGSDMVLSLQMLTRHYSRTAFLGVLADVMDRTPNIGSLHRAGGFAAEEWGGRGTQDINLICDLHADSVPDENFDTDICKVLLVGNRAPRAAQAQGLESVANKYHPSLDYLRAWYLTNAFDRPRTDTERQIVHDYLQGDNVAKLEIAERYRLSFPRSDEMAAVLTDVVVAAKAEARETLVHDPYNIDAIDTLLLKGSLLSTVDFDFQRDVRAQNTAILNARRAVAQPFNVNVWLDLARSYGNNYEYAQENRAMPFYRNAIFYSDHEVYVIEAMLFHMIDRLGYASYERNPNDPVIRITSDFPKDVVCEFVRLDRLLTHQCRAAGRGPENCPSIKEIQPDYDRFVSEAISTDLCSAETGSSIADLKYQPSQVLLEGLSQPLVWD